MRLIARVGRWSHNARAMRDLPAPAGEVKLITGCVVDAACLNAKFWWWVKFVLLQASKRSKPSGANGRVPSTE
jgi:hypothetical protein